MHRTARTVNNIYLLSNQDTLSLCELSQSSYPYPSLHSPRNLAYATHGRWGRDNCRKFRRICRLAADGKDMVVFCWTALEIPFSLIIVEAFRIEKSTRIKGILERSYRQCPIS